MDLQATSNVFRISQASPEDAAGIGRVVYDAWVDTYPNDELGITVDLVKTWVAGNLSTAGIAKRAQRYQVPRDPDVLNLVAKMDGVIVGMAIGNRSVELEQWVGSIYVSPQWHSIGIGAQLMDALLKWFDLDRPIWLRVATYNARTIRFYERFGFTACEEAESNSTTQHVGSGAIPQVKMVREPSLR